MDIYIQNTYDRKLEEFNLRYNEKEYILNNKEKKEVQILEVTGEKCITIRKESNYDDELKKNIGIIGWIACALGVLIILMIDIISYKGGETLSELIEPLMEEYTLQLQNKQSYQLVYHRGYFEMFTHEYKYPYLTDIRGNKLEAKYSYTMEGIDKSFIFAKIYRFWVVLGLSFLVGVILNIILGHSIILFTMIIFSISEIFLEIVDCRFLRFLY